MNRRDAMVHVRAGLVTLLSVAGLACGQTATPTTPTAPATPTPATSATAGNLTSSLSAAFDALTIPANAGCSISVSQYGQVVLERGRGQIAPGRAAAADSLYRIGSLTKPITASAVLISERAGRVSRNDKINRFVAFPEPAPTIDELIKHVPGLSNYTATAPYAGGRTFPTTLDNLLSLIQPWDGVRRSQYSNSHYVLLGAALQQMNGLRYEEVVQRDIFGPAGMSQSSFAVPPLSEVISSAALTDSSWAYAAGAVTATAADINRFNQALLNNVFGFGAVESFDRSSGGRTSFGMGSTSAGGDLRFAHAGIIDNYNSYSVLFPADRSSVVVLCNFLGQGLQNFVEGPGGIRSLLLAR